MSDDSDSRATDDIEVDQRVERTDVGVSITAELKRGNGTRDQDKLTAKVKRHSYDAARDEMDAAMDDLRRWADECREIQPEGDDA